MELIACQQIIVSGSGTLGRIGPSGIWVMPYGQVGGRKFVVGSVRGLFDMKQGIF